MTDELALFDDEKTQQTTAIFAPYGAGETEFETRAAIAEIEEVAPITGAKRAIKQLCFSLAKSIDKGNQKGRAIANEAGQLFLMMQQLAPPEAEALDDSALSPELKRLFDAFASPAQFDTAPEPDPAPTGDGA